MKKYGIIYCEGFKKSIKKQLITKTLIKLEALQTLIEKLLSNELRATSEQAATAAEKIDIEKKKALRF